MIIIRKRWSLEVGILYYSYKLLYKNCLSLRLSRSSTRTYVYNYVDNCSSVCAPSVLLLTRYTYYLLSIKLWYYLKNLKNVPEKKLTGYFRYTFQNQVFRWCKIYILFTKNVRNFHNQLQSIGIRQKCIVILRTLQRGREVLWNILFLCMIHDTYL